MQGFVTPKSVAAAPLTLAPVMLSWPPPELRTVMNFGGAGRPTSIAEKLTLVGETAAAGVLLEVVWVHAALEQSITTANVVRERGRWLMRGALAKSLIKTRIS